MFSNSIQLRRIETTGQQISTSRPFDLLVPDPFMQTQWWYVNGALNSNQNRWDFELVFFLRKTDLDQVGKLPMKWLRPQLSAAHFSYLKNSKDEKLGQFHYHQKGGLFSRNSLQTATDKFAIELGGWSLSESDNTLHLHIAEEEVLFDLQLEFTGRLIAHGEIPGISPRSHEKYTGSEHVSLSRLRARGVIREANAQPEPVTGVCWLDFERQLLDSERLKNGWDWFALHLSDGSDLMIYNIHRNMNSTCGNEFSFGTYIDAELRVTHLSSNAFEIRPTRTWTSPETRAIYPIGFEIRVPRLNLEFHVAAVHTACELNCRKTTFVSYWEGPIQVEGSNHGHSIKGRGFLELVGYDMRTSSLWIHEMLRPLSVDCISNSNFLSKVTRHIHPQVSVDSASRVELLFLVTRELLATIRKPDIIACFFNLINSPRAPDYPNQIRAFLDLLGENFARQNPILSRHLEELIIELHLLTADEKKTFHFYLFKTGRPVLSASSINTQALVTPPEC